MLIIIAIALAIIWLGDHVSIKRKALGLSLIAIGLDWISPPYPTTDLPLFLWWLHEKGVMDLPPLNEIPTLYAEYVPIAMAVGVGITLLGMWIGGVRLKTVKRKLRRLL